MFLFFRVFPSNILTPNFAEFAQNSVYVFEDLLLVENKTLVYVYFKDFSSFIVS